MIDQMYDYYNNCLCHYGTTRSSHKYIDRHMGKNGRWIYTYPKLTPSQHTHNRHFGDESITLNRTGLKLQAKHLKNKAVKGYVETKYKIKKANRKYKLSDAAKAYFDVKTGKYYMDYAGKAVNRGITKLETRSQKREHAGRRNLMNKGGSGQYQTYLERRSQIQSSRPSNKKKKTTVSKYKRK